MKSTTITELTQEQITEGTRLIAEYSTGLKPIHVIYLVGQDKCQINMPDNKVDVNFYHRSLSDLNPVWSKLVDEMSGCFDKTDYAVKNSMRRHRNEYIGCIHDNDIPGAFLVVSSCIAMMNKGREVGRIHT